MHMDLAHIASAYEERGYKVTRKPSIIGSSGAVHQPDLLVVKDATLVVYVVDGKASGEVVVSDRLLAKDLNARAVVVADDFEEEALEFARHYDVELVRGFDLGIPAAPPEMEPERPPHPTGPAKPAPPEPVPLEGFDAASEPPPAVPIPPVAAIDPASNAFVLRDPEVWGTLDRLAEVQRVIREGRTFERTSLWAPSTPRPPPPTLPQAPVSDLRSGWLRGLRERRLL